jgi:TrmH family RNA methyltransferase
MDIVFVEPEIPGNIGSVARAMKNFGFGKLVLVNPCKITDEAYSRAKHAKDIVQNAEILDAFDQLLERYDFLVATTAKLSMRDDRFVRSYIKANELKEKLGGVKGRMALLFGRESKGLYNKELEKCDLIVHIPTSCYRAMNVGQAAAILLYELSKIEPKQRARIASKKEVELLLDSWKTILDTVGVKEYKKETTYMIFKRVIGRAIITGREYSTLQGVFRKILKRLK